MALRRLTLVPTLSRQRIGFMEDSRNVLEICPWILHPYGKTLGTKYPMMQRHIPEQSDTSTTAMVNSKN